MSRPFRDQACSGCGAPLGTTGSPTTSEDVLHAVAALAPSERAMLRSRLLATYDVRGDMQRRAGSTLAPDGRC